MGKAQLQRLMDLFGKRGPEEGEVAHYVKADGTGGFTIDEVDDPATPYAAALAYNEFIEFHTSPVLKIDDAIGPITTYLS